MPPQTNVRFGMLPPDGDSSFTAVLKGDRSVNVILRPRRFGKSMNLTMLNAFFGLVNCAAKRRCFRGLLIEKNRPDLFADDGPFGRCPVILLDLKSICGSTWDEMIGDIHHLVARTYDFLGVRTLMNALFRRIRSRDISVDPSTLAESLRKLTELLTQHRGQPCIVLVDEYDTPLTRAHSAPLESALPPNFSPPGEFFLDARDFLGKMFAALLKGNDDNLHMAVLVGILRVAGSDFLSGLNNVRVFTLADPTFSDKFGFSEKEVELLLRKHQPRLDLAMVKSLYNGYETVNGMALFNPWSIISLCATGELENHWKTTIKTLFSFQGQEFKDLVSAHFGDRIGQVLEYLSQSITPCDMTHCRQILKMLTFVRYCIFLASDFRYDIESNAEAGSGQFGLVIHPQQHLPIASLAIIIEFNVAGEAEEARAAARRGMKQIREKKYRARFGECKNICEIGIGLNGESCFVVGKRVKKIDGVWNVVATSA
ncbi:hypothetical protein BJ741DRAFT_714628 [Chytriomyces cf. hyalinus JEL632]|nr:hypothetical protein BJ741DRAFT_714628 [Chytriomyces cf. hyalinus JEL632]